MSLPSLLSWSQAFTYKRKTGQIKPEAALDGIYVLRTSVTDTELDRQTLITAADGEAARGAHWPRGTAPLDDGPRRNQC
jgi:hypothetical protein